MICRVIVTYYLYNAIEYVCHKIGHYKHDYNIFYYLHIKHHREHYPYNNLISDTYRTNYEGLIFLVPAICVSYMLYISLIYDTFIKSMCQLILNILINDYIHGHIHTKNSWLEKYKWFQECRRLHFTHHKRFNKNLSFGYDYTIDKMNDTFLK